MNTGGAGGKIDKSLTPAGVLCILQWFLCLESWGGSTIEVCEMQANILLDIFTRVHSWAQTFVMSVASHMSWYKRPGSTCFYLYSYNILLQLQETLHTPPELTASFQFLKAPHLLALAMNSFSRGPSICQNAVVCVTSVKWLTQNLKQNSSKS